MIGGGLFTDPRHFRGDCRALRRAIHRGWLNTVPQEHRDDLCRRFEAAFDEAHGDRSGAPAEMRPRMVFAAAYLMIGMSQHDLRAFIYQLSGKPDGPWRGRPRWSRRLQDFAPYRVAAGPLGRAFRGRVASPFTIHRLSDTLGAVDFPLADGRADRAALYAIRNRSGRGERWSLQCPLCQHSRMHLYRFADGVACRGCARLSY